MPSARFHKRRGAWQTQRAISDTSRRSNLRPFKRQQLEGSARSSSGAMKPRSDDDDGQQQLDAGVDESNERRRARALRLRPSTGVTTRRRLTSPSSRCSGLHETCEDGCEHQWSAKSGCCHTSSNHLDVTTRRRWEVMMRRTDK